MYLVYLAVSDEKYWKAPITNWKKFYSLDFNKLDEYILEISEYKTESDCSYENQSAYALLIVKTVVCDTGTNIFVEEATVSFDWDNTDNCVIVDYSKDISNIFNV